VDTGGIVFRRGRTPPTIEVDAVHRARQGDTVKKALAIVLIVGFLLVDFLFFHDILKPGEAITFPQYLTGLLSVPVILVSAWFLLRDDGQTQALG
jgi:hypothetical protein